MIWLTVELLVLLENEDDDNLSIYFLDNDRVVEHGIPSIFE